MAEAARRQYNKLKMQTKAEIRQTIDQLLVGEFIVSNLLWTGGLTWSLAESFLYQPCCLCVPGKQQALDHEIRHQCSSGDFP